MTRRTRRIPRNPAIRRADYAQQFAALMVEEYTDRAIHDIGNVQSGLYNFDTCGKYIAFLRSQADPHPKSKGYCYFLACRQIASRA